MNSKLTNNSWKIFFLFFMIFVLGLSIRIYYIPYELPLTSDAMDNFTFASAISYYGTLPSEWSPPFIGWPVFLSFWFSIINFENTFDTMQIQKILSAVLSVLIIIPVYLLCRKFFEDKIALVGAAIFSFDPRIILNSTLGITEPLFILLGFSSLVTFLKYDKKMIFFSYLLVVCATIVRSEGVFIFFTITILFLIKFKFSKEIIKTLIPCIVIFMIILGPISIYKIETSGYDGIFQRIAYGTDEILSNTKQDGPNQILGGITLFVKYLGWIMIPILVIFLPLGFIQFLRNRNSETNFVLVYLIVCSIPIFYAYISQAHDTRYLYILYPIFCLISLFAVKKYISKIKNQNRIIGIIIIGILIGSLSFYEYKKMDYQKEIELYKIAEIISKKLSGVNYHPSETKFIRASELPNEWPFVMIGSGVHEIKIIQTYDSESLEEFIKNSRGNLTHLLVDNNEDLPEFLHEVYEKGESIIYLEKEFDSKDAGFNHHIKLFKINFEKFDLTE